MKTYFSLLASVIVALGLVPATAQMGAPSAPQFGNGMDKLFGDNQTFSATMEMQVNSGGSPITMSGKMNFDQGNSRVEMDMSAMKGTSLPPDAAGMMKSAGLDRMVTISLANKKTAYVIYPNAQAYAEMTPPNPDATGTNEVKMEVTELGKETLDGHECIKNKAVITDKQGAQHVFTVWNATDLKKFPVKFSMNEQGNAATTSFRDVTFGKPAASLFTPPSGFTKYESPQEMMQAVMMKSISGGVGIPPGSIPLNR
jgi:outer membrane lipoprotein-sorting protein